jgi:GNAT superfamily N-acetyltransferase
MVFKGKNLEDKLNPKVKVKEISESEADVYSKLLLTVFEMPFKWKKGVDAFILEIMRKGAKCYLAYVGKKPVGISSLLSFMKTGGVFNVGSLKTYRRQGIGTTLVAHTVMDSIKEGNTLHILYTEKHGNPERLYNKIGFKPDHTVVWFVKHLGKLPS